MTSIYGVPISIPDETPIDPHTARVKALIKRQSTDLSEYLETRNRLVSAGCTDIGIYNLLNGAAMKNLEPEDRKVFFRDTTAYTRPARPKPKPEPVHHEVSEEELIENLNKDDIRRIVRSVPPYMLKHFPELRPFLDNKR